MSSLEQPPTLPQRGKPENWTCTRVGTIKYPRAPKAFTGRDVIRISRKFRIADVESSNLAIEAAGWLLLRAFEFQTIGMLVESFGSHIWPPVKRVIQRFRNSTGNVFVRGALDAAVSSIDSFLGGD